MAKARRKQEEAEQKDPRLDEGREAAAPEAAAPEADPGEQKKAAEKLREQAEERLHEAKQDLVQAAEAVRQAYTDLWDHLSDESKLQRWRQWCSQAVADMKDAYYVGKDGVPSPVDIDNPHPDYHGEPYRDPIEDVARLMQNA